MENKVKIGKHTSELMAYLLLLPIAAGTVVLALRFPRPEDAHSGPGSFPLFLGSIMGVMAICGIGPWLRKKNVPADEPDEQISGKRSPVWPLGILTALYLLLMPLIGFICGTTLLCMASLIVLGYRKIVRALAVGFLTAFALYAVFGILMNVALPKGWIG